MTSVLILDSRATHRAIYSQLAGSLGRDVAVRAFGHAPEALDWLKEHRADLIVADSDAPKVDGDEFLARLKLLPGAHGAPILMISASSERQKRLRALEGGATDVLRTPLDHSEFIARARNLIALSRSPAPQAIGGAETPGAAAAELLSGCGAGGYAIHVVEIKAEGATPDLAPLLRGLLRGGDRVARLDGARYAIFQTAAARPVEARALARRLRAVAALREGARQLRLGMALPAPSEGGAPEERAAACLRAALGDLRTVWRAGPAAAARENFRLAPVLDLGAGALVAAEWRRGGAMGEASDAEALRLALEGTAKLREAGRKNFRALMRLRLAGDGVEAAMLRLTALVAREKDGAPLDVAVPAADLAADFAAASRAAKAIRALNLGLAVDLGAPSERALKTLAPLLAQALRQGWCDALRFCCPDAAALAAAVSLRDGLARDSGAAPLLRAAEVASVGLLPALLRAGVALAQGPCLGAPLALESLIGWRAAPDDGPSAQNRRA